MKIRLFKFSVLVGLLFVLAGCSPLSPMQKAVKNGENEELSSLMAKHSDEIYRIDPVHGSLLCIAARFDQPAMLKYLVKSGLDVNVKNGDGSTAFHCAVSKEFVGTMLELGGNPYIDSYEHISPLAVAVKFGRYEVAKKLISFGLKDISWKVGNRFTALDYAIAECHLDTAELVLKHQLAEPKIYLGSGCEAQTKTLLSTFGVKYE